MSKTSQQRRSAYQLGYKDGKSGKWVIPGRYKYSRWRIAWSYRRGFRAGERERKYSKYPKKSFIQSRGAEIALDLIVGSILVILVAYVAGLIGK